MAFHTQSLDRSAAAKKQPDLRGPLQLFAVAAPGLEDLVHRELQSLPSLHPSVAPTSLQVVPGGVLFTGDLSTVVSANLHLRCASRVLLRFAEIEARELTKLERALALLPWHLLLPPRARVDLGVHVHCERCRLYHTGAIADCVARALSASGYAPLPTTMPASTEDLSDQASPSASDITFDSDSDSDRAGSAGRALASPATPVLGVWLRGQHDRFTVSIDTSGALLHMRGYRREEGAAPLRETLAAAILQLAGYATGPLYDPMCGSGTLAIEAALLGLRRAPGLGRRFAFSSWPSLPGHLWPDLVEQARAREQSGPTLKTASPIWASDRDPQVVDVARRNAERAGVADRIHFSVADVGMLRLPSALPFAGHGSLPGLPPGLVICNPPYGRRIGDANLGGLYRKLARLVRSAPGWRMALLTASPQLAHLALRHASAIPLHSGGLKVALYLDARVPLAIEGKRTGPQQAGSPA